MCSLISLAFGDLVNPQALVQDARSNKLEFHSQPIIEISLNCMHNKFSQMTRMRRRKTGEEEEAEEGKEEGKE